MMLNWIKDKWEFIAAGLTVLLVFVLGRKSKEKQVQVAEATVDLIEEELEVEKELSAEEKLQLAKAHSKYVNTRIALRKKQRKAATELERAVITRKLELIELAKEDPEKIDRILLKEFNIHTIEDDTQ